MMQNKQTRGKDARLPGDAVNSHYAIDVSTTVTLVIPISQQTTEKTHILEAEPLINISIYTNTNTNVTRGPLNIPLPRGERGFSDREETYRYGYNTTQTQGMCRKCLQYGLYPERHQGGAHRPCPHPCARAISPEHLHLVLEGLGLLSCGLGHLEHLHGHIAVPPPTKHGPKRARPDPLQQLHLTGWHLPVIARVPVPQILLRATRAASQGPAHTPHHSACGAPTKGAPWSSPLSSCHRPRTSAPAALMGTWNVGTSSPRTCWLGWGSPGGFHRHHLYSRQLQLRRGCEWSRVGWGGGLRVQVAGGLTVSVETLGRELEEEGWASERGHGRQQEWPSPLPGAPL